MGTGKKERSTAKEPSHGQMAIIQKKIITLAIGSKVYRRAREPLLGQMVKRSPATGKMARCRAKENSAGPTSLNMMAITKTV